MKIERIDLRIVRMPLTRPFTISSCTHVDMEHILVQVTADGFSGWGECACLPEPGYCPETTETCWHILHDFLAPGALKAEWESVDELMAPFGWMKGNAFARAGLEIAAWDLLGRKSGQSLSEMLGGTRAEIHSGVSLGIEKEIGRLFALIEKYLGEGYQRIKLKIGPGRDVEIIRRVRERFPKMLLQVDANSAYTLADVPLLKALDAFDLLMIEQPLAHDDIIDHARVQAQLQTPICLDESIHSVEDARKALELGSCRIINIKVSRLGGLAPARRVHDFCHARGVPVWCGGMHEFGIGRAANVAMASLPGFTLMGDVCGSDKSYSEDIVEPAILAKRGAIAVPRGPGLGHEPVMEKIARRTVRAATLTAH